MRHTSGRSLGWTASGTTRAAIPLAAGLLAVSALGSAPALADESTGLVPSTPVAGPPVAGPPVADAAAPAGVAAESDQPQPGNSSQPTNLPAGQVPVPQPTVDAATQRRLAREQRERRLRASVVALARKQVGDRYIAGRTGPDAFDCSGLVRYVMGNVLDRWLPHYSRTQYRVADRISLRSIRPGDLVFYFRHGAHHVGIYVGDGHMVHAANPRAGVRIGRIGGPWYSRSFTGVGRLIPAT